MKSRGFTLLELLVVMVIVGVLAGTVVLGFVGADREQVLKTEAERLALVIELAREEAIRRNEEWGLYIDPAEYAFAVFDPERGWVAHEERPFDAHTVEQAALTARIDARQAVKLDSEQKAEMPAIVILSSGEQTPFEIELKPAWAGNGWVVRSDGLSRTRAERAG